MKKMIFAALYVLVCIAMCTIAMLSIMVSVILELPAGATLCIVVVCIVVFTFFLCQLVK